MRRVLIGGVLALLALTAQAQSSSRPQQHLAAAAQSASKAHVLTRAELDKLLAHPADLLVVDVRRPDEVSKIGGLPVYLSVQLSELEQSVAWIPKGRTIVTLSNHAKRAGTAADFLASRGFKVAGAAGAQTYEQEGGKLTRIVAPSPPNNAGSPSAAAVNTEKPAAQ